MSFTPFAYLFSTMMRPVPGRKTFRAIISFPATFGARRSSFQLIHHHPQLFHTPVRTNPVFHARSSPSANCQSFSIGERQLLPAAG